MPVLCSAARLHASAVPEVISTWRKKLTPWIAYAPAPLGWAADPRSVDTRNVDVRWVDLWIPTRRQCSRTWIECRIGVAHQRRVRPKRRIGDEFPSGFRVGLRYHKSPPDSSETDSHYFADYWGLIRRRRLPRCSRLVRSHPLDRQSYRPGSAARLTGAVLAVLVVLHPPPVKRVQTVQAGPGAPPL